MIKKAGLLVGLLGWSHLIVIVPLIAMLMFVSSAFAQPSDWTGNAHLFLGAKFLDKDDWAPTEDQFEFGGQFDFRQRSWPINLAVDLLYGIGEGQALGTNFESDILELDMGVRKIFLEETPGIRPYFGGGLTIVRAEFSGLGISDDDIGAGGWVGGGFYVPVQENWNIGFDVRYSTAKVDLFGVSADAGGFHIGLITGFHW